MAVAFANCDIIISEEHAEHINQRHVRSDIHLRASKFKSSFNLTATLAMPTRKTWVRELESDYQIIERGFKEGHGEFYIYVFRLGKVVGTDPWGFPSRDLCIYYSWKPAYGDRMAVISAYPFSRSYHDFLKQRKL